MHELLLHGTVPSTRHNQVLSILAGIAAMQPQPYHERRHIYKPTRPIVRPSMQVGGSQAVQSKQANPMQTVQGAIQGDLFYLHLVEDLVAESEGKGDVEIKGEGGEVGGVEMMDSGDGADGHQTISTTPSTTTTNRKPPTWTLQFRDIPEAGTRRPVTTRLIADIPITGGNAQAFMSALEYTYVPSFSPRIRPGNLLKKKNSHTSTHHLKGHRLTHNSTSILLFQPLIPNSPAPISSTKNTTPNSTPAPIPTTTTSSAPNTKPHPLTPNAYILQLSILITDGTKPALMERGVKELIALKELLKGVVEVDLVERGALDTRVR
ncbi:MAG: hypothetical protein Q9215_006615 [Flavoplaca cf. flavocitrina]